MTATGIGLAAVGAIALSSPQPIPALRPAAASQAVTAPAEGAYWHTRTLWKGTYSHQLGRGKNRYWVEQQSVAERWTALDGRTWRGFRDLGVRPKSAADERAWRRDGSPTTWTRTANGMTASLSTKPDKGMVILDKGAKGAPLIGFDLVDRMLSYEQAQALPTDPAGLKAWIDKASRDPNAHVSDDFRESYVRGQLVGILSEAPVKEVRAAAYEALPTMPGVRSLGKAEDPRGRTGQGFLVDVDSGKGSGGSRQKQFTVTERLIVDTGTMTPLASDVKTTVDGEPFPAKTSTTITLQAGWTDGEPAVPALP
ncbi:MULTISPECIES: hypothetical protein [Streptosporangium]|uniref:CU044_5270 family protein n=1 Tax=Streptosporangium brasiliense TaxID=47480 RepID=A0ABT9QY43_9ACTN|nr:hypothetical protein [Streptosporangium brasiliense]MDP9861885.1 hypothetical protein [Streptosporangium brasiliense]